MYVCGQCHKPCVGCLQAARLGKNIVQFRDVLAFKSHGGRLRQAKKGVLQVKLFRACVEWCIFHLMLSPYSSLYAHNVPPSPLTLIGCGCGGVHRGAISSNTWPRTCAYHPQQGYHHSHQESQHQMMRLSTVVFQQYLCMCTNPQGVVATI